jgi:Zn-dependent peptidase ImmA (M78 family)
LKINSPPVPIKELAQKVGLKVISYDLSEDVSGLLIINDSVATIGYNPNNPKVRQRFTIAHELGHYLLHTNNSPNEMFIDKDFIVKWRSDKKYTPTEIKQEQAANAFAAAILMPKDLISAEIAKKDYHDLTETEFIEELANVFDVSIQAMSYRLANLNLFI